MKLNRQKKIAVLVFCSLFILVLITAAVLELTVPHYIEKKELYYTYNSRGSIDYKVYLKPNALYDDEYLGKDRFYISKYIDRLEMEFEYSYSGSAPVDFITEYSVTAYLQGLHGPDSEVLWSKVYPLVQAETINGEYRSIRITERATIDPAVYNIMKEKVFLDTELNMPVVLNVVFKVRSWADTGNGVLEDSLSPSLAIPIGERVFKIDGQPVLTGEDRIEKTVREKVPANSGKVILFSAFSLILIIIMIIVARLEETEQPDPYEKTIARIFKEYGERMAGMDHAISYLLTEVIQVTSIEDMVKIADEVGQPVFYYKVDNRDERKIEFYVFDSNRIYYMVIFGEVK